MRLLVKKEWFETISSEGQYETDFESIIQSRCSLLFPEYHAIPFKVPVESETERRIPDLALIERRYRHWWVVEVEMAHHSLNGHVLPQIDVFSRGTYGASHREYLLAKSDALNPTALADMIKGTQPRILVIVNRSVPDWVRPIHDLGGLLSVVEVFRSGRNEHILRINGDYPTANAEEVVSTCRLDEMMPRLLRVDSPADLRIAPGERLSIGFGGGFTDWERVDSADQVWLFPVKRHPLSAGKSYVILRDSHGGLSFKKQ